MGRCGGDTYRRPCVDGEEDEKSEEADVKEVSDSQVILFYGHFLKEIIPHHLYLFLAVVGGKVV